jgi:hypothetical protein
VRRKRTGAADYHRGHWLRRPQGSVTESLRVTLSSFRKLYDLLCDCISGRSSQSVRVLEGYKGHLESDAQKTCGLGIKPVPLEVSSDRHGVLCAILREKLNRKNVAVKWGPATVKPRGARRVVAR